MSRSLAVMRGGSITSVSFVDDPRVLACSLCTAEAGLASIDEPMQIKIAERRVDPARCE